MIAAASTPLDRLWPWIARPFHPRTLVTVLFGVEPTMAQAALSYFLISSSEASALLDAGEQGMTNLRMTTAEQSERCVGQLRGPVLWNETMATQAMSVSADDVYVCRTQRRVYDTIENRLLVAALFALVEARQHLPSTADLPADDAMLGAHHQATRAARLLQHDTLSGIPHVRIDQRAVQRVTAGARRPLYQCAAALHRRMWRPPEPARLACLLDDTTARLILRLVSALEARVEAGHPPELLQIGDGELSNGAVRYRHPGLPGPTSYGVWVDGELIDANSDQTMPERV